MMAIAALSAVADLVLTDTGPRARELPRPDAEQVSTAREAIWQLRTEQATAGVSKIRYSSSQLTALSALASEGFRPDRLEITVDDNRLLIIGSHRLRFSKRWLNISIVSEGRHLGLPPAQVRIGSLIVPKILSRPLFEAIRFALNMNNGEIPPLDQMIRQSVIANNMIAVVIQMPRKTGLFDELAGGNAEIDARAAAAAYCRLVAAQRVAPTSNFAELVRRAFSVWPADGPSVAYNRVQFVALAMLTVDSRIGELIGGTPADVAACVIPPVVVSLNGRADLPKHWSLSAALAVSTGAQLAQAMGQWKELADSLAPSSAFAEGDPSGFSFIDLAADRSGILVAAAATTPTLARPIAARLAQVTAPQLLPPKLMHLEDGRSNPAFVRTYGGTEDVRFRARIRQIDHILQPLVMP